jgi:hypothetical protein
MGSVQWSKAEKQKKAYITVQCKLKSAKSSSKSRQKKFSYYIPVNSVAQCSSYFTNGSLAKSYSEISAEGRFIL